MRTKEDILCDIKGLPSDVPISGRTTFTLEEVDKAMDEWVNEKINKPSTVGFIESVKIEMAHQYEKWGDESHKPLLHFTSVLTYLVGKLIRAAWDGDKQKIKHHLMTVAAVAGSAYKYYFPDEF
jgi:hypothetical protein